MENLGGELYGRLLKIETLNGAQCSLLLSAESSLSASNRVCLLIIMPNNWHNEKQTDHSLFKMINSCNLSREREREIKFNFNNRPVRQR